MRVYRAREQAERQQAGSLTIREGISRLNNCRKREAKFPHYTWGYIVSVVVFWRERSVPSLYVRVYRIIQEQINWEQRSLTIREGISQVCRARTRWQMFPHYTWGYIEIRARRAIQKMVPSLYVRVYRDYENDSSQRKSSLTIREGISAQEIADRWDDWFPHYTWGYIIKRIPDDYEIESSLTIREGISQAIAKGKEELEFPHYTWGYIGRTSTNREEQYVPSLYVRVYRHY